MTMYSQLTDYGFEINALSANDTFLINERFNILHMLIFPFYCVYI